MIERFNFYDIYGYLLPGLALVALVWLPFGIVAGRWPPADWGSAIVGLVLAYVLGHVLQTLAARALPSTVRDSTGSRRYPSDVLLDDGDTTLLPELKQRLIARIFSRFDIDVSTSRTADRELRRRRREDAFFLCRRTLTAKGAGSYAEQFEGMYVLMRGLMAVAILTAGYHAGWAAGPLLMHPAIEGLSWPLVGILAAIVAILGFTEKAGILFWLITALFFALAATLARGRVTTAEESLPFVGIVLALIFVAARCRGAYHYFAMRFAITVYRDFSAA